MSDDDPQPVALSGRIEKRALSKGSKSERMGFLFFAEGREYLIRSAEGSAMTDPYLEPFDGKEVNVRGTLLGNLIIAESVALK